MLLYVAQLICTSAYQTQLSSKQDVLIQFTLLCLSNISHRAASIKHSIYDTVVFDSAVYSTQYHLQELKHLNLSVFKRLESLLKDESRSYIFYPTEFSAETAVLR